MENDYEERYTESDIQRIAQTVLGSISANEHGATVIALQGDLGAGKTTLTQELARILGIEETVVSPTFVVMKRYKTHGNEQFHTLTHMDAYRIEEDEELGPLGWNLLLNEKGNLLVVEWPEKIATMLPKEHIHHFVISHDGDMRSIKKIT